MTAVCWVSARHRAVATSPDIPQQRDAGGRALSGSRRASPAASKQSAAAHLRAQTASLPRSARILLKNARAAPASVTQVASVDSRPAPPRRPPSTLIIPTPSAPSTAPHRLPQHPQTRRAKFERTAHPGGLAPAYLSPRPTPPQARRAEIIPKKGVEGREETTPCFGRAGYEKPRRFSWFRVQSPPFLRLRHPVAERQYSLTSGGQRTEQLRLSLPGTCTATYPSDARRGESERRRGRGARGRGWG